MKIFLQKNFFNKIRKKIIEFLKKNKNTKVRFVLNCILLKPEEDETKSYFQSETESNLEGTDEIELIKRAEEKND